MNNKEKLVLLHAEKKNAEHDISQLEASYTETASANKPTATSHGSSERRTAE